VLSFVLMFTLVLMVVQRAVESWPSRPPRMREMPLLSLMVTTGRVVN
jgi:hypothetical protein